MNLTLLGRPKKLIEVGIGSVVKMELGPRQKAWIEALKSGKYSQCIRVLHIENEYCCLGVACELSEIGEW